MKTNNIKAVPNRQYGCLESVSDEILNIIREEQQAELQRLHDDLRELGAERNGLAHIELELRLRGYL